MNTDFQITATIVIYNQNIQILQKAVDSFLKIPLKKRLFIIDNASALNLSKNFKHTEIKYIYLNKNIGFSKAHNYVINKLNSEFHLVLNPDIEFNPLIIRALLNKLRFEKDTIFITPKIVYPDGSLQQVCRKHPTFFNLLNRKLNFSKTNLFQEEYAINNLEEPFYPEFIHGCFMLFKTKDFKKLNGFDERYFLYLEDADICRKIEKLNKKILYFPKVEAIHQHQKGSAKSLKLFFLHTISAIQYFLKWGVK